MGEIGFLYLPLIALVLANTSLYQEYLTNPVSEDIPLVEFGLFFSVWPLGCESST